MDKEDSVGSVINEDDSFDSAFDSFVKGHIPEEAQETADPGDSGDAGESKESSEAGEEGSGEVGDVEDNSGGNEDENTQGEQFTQGSEASENTESKSDTKTSEKGIEDDPVAKRIQLLEDELAKLKSANTSQESAKEETTPEEPVYSSDEVESLKKYREEWEDVAKGEALTRRGEYKELTEYIFNQVYEAIAPLVRYVQERSPRDQYRDLKSEIEDYDDVRDKAVDWVKTQPAFLQATYNEVIEKGSVEQVAELIRHFKETTNYGKTAPAQSAAKPSVRSIEKKAEPSVKRAASALRVVQTKQSGKTGSADPDDFDSAFDEFAKLKQ
jgi:hypothetical protein